tara:strand:- start:2237 stop:3136 length:900 start_codon:yes stop_codon:yes gene_type:complete
MKFTNKYNLPEIYVRAVTNDPYDSSGSDISTTVLLGPPRINALRKIHADFLTEDVSDRFFALDGQATHYVIERAKTENDLVEERLFYKDDDVTNGWTLSGQFDVLNKDGNLIDVKNCSVWGVVYGKIEWEQQLNILDFLCRKNSEVLTIDGKSIAVKKLSILAFMRDWNKDKAEKSDNYPKARVVEVPIKRWTEQEQEDYIRERIKLHQDALKGDTLPLCTPDERWHKPGVFALMKGGRKSSVKNCATRKESEDYCKEKNIDLTDKSHTIIERPGSDNRCESYCNVNQFCSYYMGVENE